MSCKKGRPAAGYDGSHCVAGAVGLAMLIAAGSTADGVMAMPATPASFTTPTTPDSLAIKETAGSANLIETEQHDITATAPVDTLTAGLATTAIPDFFDTGISGTAAVLMTPVFPGWGQLYTENSWRAALAFGVQWYFWSQMLARDRQAVRYRNFAQTLPGEESRAIYDSLTAEYWEQMRDLAWWSGAIMLIIALDAYVGSGLYGFEQEPLPVPRRFDEFFDRDKPEPVGSRGTQLLVIWKWGKRF